MEEVIRNRNFEKLFVEGHHQLCDLCGGALRMQNRHKRKCTKTCFTEFGSICDHGSVSPNHLRALCASFSLVFRSYRRPRRLGDGEFGAF